MSGTTGNLLAGGGANAPAGNVIQQGAAGNAIQQGAQGGGPNIVPPAAPLCGGVMQFSTHQVPWTSGLPGVLQEPVSHSAFCSQDSLKDAMKSKERNMSRSAW